MADPTYHFLSHVRSGFATTIAQPDTFGSAQPALATALVGVTVSGVAQPVTHQAAVRGPGDVIGLSASQVVRTDPIDGAVGVEPNYFAQIEFDRPDLPWLFTPAAAVGERLRPWIVLVVLDAEGPDACAVRPGAPLPVLSVSSEAAGALPDLSASHLWAHAQVILPPGGALADAFKAGADPRMTVSRLLCPRHLAPNRWYVAAVVPAFNVGRLAGLGMPVAAADEHKLEAAWQAGAKVDLPVYHSWRFRTGEDADFERLARQLKGRPLPKGVGTRPLDVSRPGAGLPALPVPADVNDAAAITWLDGALRPLDSDSLPAREPTAAAAFQTSLTVLLDRPADLLLAGDADPIVAPPIYGDKHALIVKVDGATAPPWIGELNLEPRNRIAAGLGTQVIQARQEDYVARAWRQLGDVLAANRLLRGAQFARSGSLRVHDRLGALDASAMLSLAYPAHQRLAGVLPGAATLSRNVVASRLPTIAVEPAFRRIARGAAGRAAGVKTLAPAVVERFSAQVFVAPVDGPDGSTGMRLASEVLGAARSTELLTAIGDNQPGTTGRLDTMLATLTSSRQLLPSGDDLRALTLRTDVGAVAVMGSLGAVPAATISAVLTAAVTPITLPPVAQPPVMQPPIVLPPVIQPTLPSPILRPGTQAHAHLPAGLLGAAAVERATPLTALTAAASTSLPVSAIDTATATAQPALGAAAILVNRGSIVFQPGGVTHPIGTGAVLRGGSVVVESDALQKIVLNQTPVQQFDDARWSTLQQSTTVPVSDKAAAPGIDAGTRLDVFRRSPAGLTALAQVANGNLNAALVLDSQGATLATSGAAATTLAGLATGQYTSLLPLVKGSVTGADDLAAAHDMVTAVALAMDRMVQIGDALPSPASPAFDLAAAKAGLMTRLDPGVTVAARLAGRLDIRAIVGVPRRDDLDPVMASPQFKDPMWQAVRDLGSGWLLPGLELVPPDTATLVRTNPAFVAAHMIGLNHEMMRELLWREYPTDQRGTSFHRFWGRRGGQPDDIGAIHTMKQGLAASLLAGEKGEAVLLLRSELLRRYPGSIVYVCQATKGADGLPVLIDDPVTLPSFRGDLPPDVSFIGFPMTPDDLRATANPWWFVIAQPPSEPRFGLDDWSSTTPAVPTSPNDLAWSHMSTDGKPDSPTPFTPANAPMLQGVTIDKLGWGQHAAGQAHLTYQHPVRVAIRALDLLPPAAPAAPVAPVAPAAPVLPALPAPGGPP